MQKMRTTTTMKMKIKRMQMPPEIKIKISRVPMRIRMEMSRPITMMITHKKMIMITKLNSKIKKITIKRNRKIDNSHQSSHNKILNKIRSYDSRVYSEKMLIFYSILFTVKKFSKYLKRAYLYHLFCEELKQ